MHLTGRITKQGNNSSHLYVRDLFVSGKQKIFFQAQFFIKSTFSL